MKLPERSAHEIPDEEVHKGLFDYEYALSIGRNVIDFLDMYYFRSRMIGFDEIPQRNNPPVPLIYAANHSGMAFPWDAIIFACSFFRISDYKLFDCFRALSAPALSAARYMEPYLIDEFWKRVGGVDATLTNFDIMMRYKDANVLIYPEGVPGIGKGFDKRYQLQRFSTSFIRMALKYKTDIIPISTINGEYINPYSYKNDELNKLSQKLGIPYLPIGPLTSLVPFQPWAFYFGMPAKLTYVMGRRIKVYEMTDKPLEKLKKREIHHIRDAVLKQMQVELDEGVARYGQDPYEFEELGDLWRDNLDKIMYILPSGWPLLFEEHDRRYLSGQTPIRMAYDNASYFETLLKNPLVPSFTLPLLGWPALLKWKGII